MWESWISRSNTGADVNSRNQFGNAPLRLAVEHGSDKFVDRLQKLM